MNTLTKGFYVIDILLLLVVVFCINHALVFAQYWPFVVLEIALLLRFNSDILLYRKERWSIVPIIGFTILFGVYYCNGIFSNTIFRMTEYPSIVLGTQDSEVMTRNEWGEVILNGLFLWVWLMPIVVYAYQSIRKQTVRNGYRWYDIACLAIFKDRVGQFLIALGVLTFIAMLVGLMMDITFSMYAVITVPVAAYYIINSYVKCKAHWVSMPCWWAHFTSSIGRSLWQMECAWHISLHTALSLCLYVRTCWLAPRKHLHHSLPC